MKKIYIILALWAVVFNVACDDNWDGHYSEDEQTINGNEAEIVDMNAIEYLSKQASYSEMYKLLQEYGMIELLESKDQQFTIMVYNNDALNSYFTDDYLYLVKNAICDIAYTPTKITDGLKILMWNGKYLTTSVDVNSDGSTVTSFDDSKVIKIIKTEDAFIYELETPVYSPKSIFEIIDGLDGEFSVFRDMIMSQNEEIFDEANSRPKGVNNAGQTEYDTVYYTYNPLYETFNFSNEFVDGTLLIPSNSVIQQCLTDAYERYALYFGEIPSESDSLKYKNWIIEAAFFNSVIAPEEWENATSKTSAFGKVWRPAVQKLNLSNSITLSNGMAYYVTEMKIPNNVIIYRIKHYFHYWSKCTEEEKEEYFKWENINLETVGFTSKESGYDVEPWSPAPGVWPEIYNKCLYANLEDSSLPYSLEFTCLTLNESGERVEVAMIPPGEYELRMGFTQHSTTTIYDLNISVNGNFVNKISLNSTTNFHYDRGSGSYPEGYTLGKNYDRDGGSVGTITVEGTGLQKLVIKMESDGPIPSAAKFDGHHWCLRPTSNNY